MVLDTLWQEFLKILAAEVGSRVVETWFKAVNLVQWDAHDKIVYLKAPNTFVKDWITAHYQHLFKQHLGRLLNEEIKGVVFVKEEAVVESKPEQHVVQEGSKAPPAKPTRFVRPSSSSAPTMLQQHYQFESFVVGPTNSLAYAAAYAVAQSPGVLYNPLLIWGGSGLGKTHLLQAIGNQLRRLNKRAAVLYQSADRFVNEFITAVRADRVPQFEARYKGADVLLMDDIQYISQKEQTQEIFSQIFNTLWQARKQIVFTSNLLPRNINGFPERISSRFEGGLVADIHQASIETRTAILHKKAALRNITLEEDIARLIVSRLGSNIRDLESGLIRVLAFASFTRQAITFDLVDKVLGHTHQVQRPLIDLGHILKQVSSYFNYSITELKSTKRTKDIVLARHSAVYLMKKMTDCSLREIALSLDRRDHSTVIHALAKVERLMACDTNFMATMAHIERSIVDSY